MKINCIIVEDEPLALKRTKSYVEKIPYLNLLDCFDNGFEAIGYLKQHAVDLLFLDIQMDELTGVQLLEALEKKPQVIITSAHQDYAIKGYELNVADYLLKPFGTDRFLQAVEKVHGLLNKARSEDRDFFFVKTDYKLERIYFEDVLYIEGMRDYRCIHLGTKRVLTSQTFTELEERLEGWGFCRVHKSYIVRLEKIEQVERNRLKIGEHQIPVSETYKENFYKLIGLSSDNK